MIQLATGGGNSGFKAHYYYDNCVDGVNITTVAENGDILEGTSSGRKTCTWLINPYLNTPDVTMEFSDVLLGADSELQVMDPSGNVLLDVSGTGNTRLKPFLVHTYLIIKYKVGSAPSNGFKVTYIAYTNGISFYSRYQMLILRRKLVLLEYTRCT